METGIALQALAWAVPWELHLRLVQGRLSGEGGVGLGYWGGGPGPGWHAPAGSRELEEPSDTG